MAKKRTAENFGTTYLDSKSKNNSIFQNFAPFLRYGRLKLKFLCERFSHCIYSSCSIELTKTRDTWSLLGLNSSVFVWGRKETRKKSIGSFTVHLLVGWEWDEIQNGWDGSHKSVKFCLFGDSQNKGTPQIGVYR